MHPTNLHMVIFDHHDLCVIAFVDIKLSQDMSYSGLDCATNSATIW